MAQTPQLITVKTMTEVRAMLSRFRQVDRISFDTETTIARPLSRKLVGMSFAVEDGAGGSAYYIPVGHNAKAQRGLFDPTMVNLPVDEVVAELSSFVRTWGGRVFLHNAVFDLMMCHLYGLELDDWKAKPYDTMIAVAVLGANHDKALEKQSKIRYGYDMKKLKRIMVDEGVRCVSEIPINSMYDYACHDAWWTLMLGIDTEPELVKKDLWKIFWELEMEVVPTVLSMLEVGIKLDVEMINRFDGQLAVKVAALEKEWKERWPGCKISSPQSIAKFMFVGPDALWTPVGEPGANGCYSTGEPAVTHQKRFAKSQDGKDAANLLLEYRSLSGIRSRYTTPLALQVDPDGRIRPSQNQVGTDTGRFSSSDPNGQNIKRVDFKRKWPDDPGSTPPIRAAFIAEDDFELVDVDYSQIELRVMAHLSQDPVMLEVYCKQCACVGGGFWEPGPYQMVVGDPKCPHCEGTGFDGDIHQTTADAAGCSRQHAKAVNFGLIYGQSANSLAKQIGVSKRKGYQFWDGYFNTYKGVQRFHRRCSRLLKERGYVRTLTGRIRYLPDIRSTDEWTRAGAERQGWNTSCQGSAADLIKIALRNQHRRWKSDGVLGRDCRMMLMVHDEMLCEIRKGMVVEQSLVIKETMESVANLRVPLLAAPQAAPNWAEAH